MRRKNSAYQDLTPETFTDSAGNTYSTEDLLKLCHINVKRHQLKRITIGEESMSKEDIENFKQLSTEELAIRYPYLRRNQIYYRKQKLAK